MIAYVGKSVKNFLELMSLPRLYNIRSIHRNQSFSEFSNVSTVNQDLKNQYHLKCFKNENICIILTKYVPDLYTENWG